MKISEKARIPLFYLIFFLGIITLLSFLRIVLAPILFSLLLAYIFNPAIEWLEKKGLPRTLIVVVSIVFSILLISISVWILVPALVTQGEALVSMIPQFKERTAKALLPIMKSLMGFEAFKMYSESATQNLTSMLTNQLSQFSSFLIDKVSSSTKFLVTFIATCILSPIFAFFVMRDFRRILLRVLLTVPPDLRQSFLKFAVQTNLTLRAVLRGQLLVIFILSTLYGFGFYFAGLPAGLVVGLVTGLAKLIPYMDLALGSILCFFILIVNDMPTQTIVAVASVFLVIQILDAVVITPRVMGQFLGLHPLIIILSVLCFGDWFGFFGVFFAIPLAAVIRVTFLSLFSAYKSSQFYSNRNVL